MIWASKYPYTAWVVGVGAVVVTACVALLAVMWCLDDGENADGDRAAESAGLPRDDKALHEYHHHIGDNHWKA